MQYRIIKYIKDSVLNDTAVSAWKGLAKYKNERYLLKMYVIFK